MTAEEKRGVLDFEWDLRKAERNRLEHGVSFDLAALVFEDPDIVYRRDYYLGEVRDWAIGSVSGHLLLVVVHTVLYEDQAGTLIRIISARKADRHERVLYREA